MNVLYIFGQPGAGKSTLMRHVTMPWCRLTTEGAKPVPHVTYVERLAKGIAGRVPVAMELGKVRMGFSGTDALSMSIQPQVIEWLKTMPCRWVLGEGDRLANKRFFEAVKAMGATLHLFHLDTPNPVAAERRAARGGAQSATWVRGRMTKVNNLARAYSLDLHRLDGQQPPQLSAAIVRDVAGLP